MPRVFPPDQPGQHAVSRNNANFSEWLGNREGQGRGFNVRSRVDNGGLGEGRCVELIWDKVVEVDDMDAVAAGRKGVVYNKNRPLIANDEGATE